MNTQILEYIEYNSKLYKNDKIVEVLDVAIDSLDNNTPDNVAYSVYKAYGIANGWLEYRAKEFAMETGLSKTAVKTQINTLTETNVITLKKFATITFIILNKA